MEVDESTGKVNVIRVVAAHDLGFAINPQMAEGQIEGGVAQGVGWALMEEMRYGRKGSPKDESFIGYKVPGALDMPTIRAILVETQEEKGPFGAKSLGESALIPTAPAIANAIYHATGVRIRELPMTPETVLRAFKSQRRGENGGVRS